MNNSTSSVVTPFVVLTTYKPKKPYSAKAIGADLVAITKEFGIAPLNDVVHGAQTTSTWCDPELHAEVRRFAQPHGMGKSWHQEGDTTPGSIMQAALVVWAARNPTQFRFAEGDTKTIHTPEPFQVVIGCNLACYHRTNPNVPKPPTRRWFFRQRVQIPKHLNLPGG